MKRLLTTGALFLCSLLTYAQFTGSGSGTENDPYLILNPIQLNQMRNFLNQSNVYFKMMADIDLTDFLEDENQNQGWQPVGTSSTPFKGILDGNGKTITGLWIDRTSANGIGLFGYTNGATIKNLNMASMVIKGKEYVGGFVGSGSTAISNCTLTGEISGVNNVGGFCGSGGTISNCHTYANVHASGNCVGGFAGKEAGTITNCSASGVIVEGNEKVGGLVGVSSSNITSSCCIGKIFGKNNVGGLAGYLSGSLSCSFVVGIIYATGDKIGGLVGEKVNNTTNSYFSGSVSGQINVGGLIGLANGSVYQCYSNASVSGKSQVGGLCGSLNNYGTLKQNAFVGLSIKATEGKVGRLFGDMGNGNIGEMGTSNENKSYNRCIVIKAGVAQDITDDRQNGTGVSATTLKLKATYVGMGWDFTNTWSIQESECYPYFNIQTAPPVILSQVVSGATTISGKCIDGGTITLEIDGVKQQMVGNGNTFSFNVSPLQAGHEVRVSAKAVGKEQSYYTTETVSYLGKGTEADPYQVYTAADLTGVYRKGYFKLMNDIDLTSYINQFSPTEGWESIGREGSETIHFDGDGHKITGLWCNTTRDNTGLFSCFANGTIKNLTVETASGKHVKGGANTGILIGKMMNGTVINCHVSGSVADGTPVGGMVGLMDGGNIQKCQATITIATAGNTTYTGGLVGEMTSGTIDQCVTTGILTATGTDSYVGGLVGKNYATITNCYSTATITSSYNAAGIVAYNYSMVDKCLYTGNLFSNNYAAGIIGYNDGENAVVQNCVATSNKIDVTYESQQVQQGGGYGQRIIGGIKNNAPAPEMNNYALKTMQVSLNDVPQRVYDDIMNGTAKTNTELKQKATYQTLGWDFDNIWNIDEDSSYPYQTVQAGGGSDPVNPDPVNPDPDPQTVVEVTDVTNMTNAIYVEPLKGSAGTDVDIEIKMKNASTATSYGFELVLPAGVTISVSTDGDFDDQVTLSTRHNGHTLTTNKLTGNTYKVAVTSLSSKSLTGSDGQVITIKAHVDNNIAQGEYAIGVQSPLIVYSDGTKPPVQSTQSKITIEDYTKGDVDGDGVIDLADAVQVINYYVGKSVASTFKEKAADIDGDNTIDLADAVKIINYYVGKINSLSRGWNNEEIEAQ